MSKSKLRCPMCGSRRVTSTTRKSGFYYGAPFDEGVFLTCYLTTRECDKCHFIYQDKVAEKQKDDAVTRYKRILVGQGIVEKDKKLEKLASEVRRLRSVVRELRKELSITSRPWSMRKMK